MESRYARSKIPPTSFCNILSTLIKKCHLNFREKKINIENNKKNEKMGRWRLVLKIIPDEQRTAMTKLLKNP